MSEEKEEKNKEDKIKSESKNDKPQPITLSLLSVHDFREKNKKTKFTSKSNNRWMLIKDKNVQKEQKENNKFNIKKIEPNFDEEKVSNTLEKWKNLQKIIKEELSLEELLIEKQKQDNSQLKNKFKDYYEVKLKNRKESEKIKNLDSNNKQKDKEKEKEYILDNNIERILLDTCEPIKNLMFLFRNYYDYTVKLSSLIGENDEEEKKDSLVELFSNQFYDNILIPSQNEDNVEISILIYKLLEDDIISMNSASIDDFLSDNTFLGKFISSYVRKDEFRQFFGKLLNPILQSIENNDDECLDISLANIKSKLLKQDIEKNKKSPNQSPNSSLEFNKDDNFDFNILYKDIKPTSIKFNKNIDFENEEIKNNEDKDNNIILSLDKDMLNKNNQKSLENNKEEFNIKYSEDLNQEKIINKILEEKNKDMKDFYIHQLEQIGSEPEIFTNVGLKNVMNEIYHKDKKRIITIYKKNFIFIKEMIDCLIQELINKINIIPYSLKCICKAISILIYKKFPNLPLYYRNSFIGKFLFDKCIFPILSLDSKNFIINRIFSSCTKKCINVIVNVLSNANRGSLYMTNSDTEKTIFNYYLIEIIPILNNFYEKLIDIKLPSIIEQYVNLIDSKIEENLDNKIFHFKRIKNPKHNIKDKKMKEENNEKINNDNNINIINKNNQVYEVYDYFKENPDEIMRLQAICFTLSDILYILSLISRNKGIFNNLPKHEFFIKTVERIQCDDYKLEEQDKKYSNNSNKLIFYIIYKDERNTQLEELFKSKKSIYTSFFSDEKLDKDPSVIFKRIKFSIKTILKNEELNFSYLNKATTTDKFFSAIYYQLKEAGENTEILDKVPIKWYSQYIYENKNKLDIKYRKNDFQYLYEKIYEDENKKLIELKDITSKLITKNNININCAEDIINKIKFSYENIIEEKKCTKIEKFIDTEEIKICMLTSKEQIIIRDVSQCQIISEYHNDPDRNKNKYKISCHTHYIKDFINKFSYNSWEKDVNRPVPKRMFREEIQRGKRTFKAYKAFKDYLDIIKKRIKDPVNNKNLFNDITDYNEILEKVEDYILRQIYKYIYPNTIDSDDIFNEKSKYFGWVTPSMLDIKNISINQLEFTENCIKKLDECKSVNDKLNCIRDAHASLNNVIKFSNGNEADAGQDEITPIFQYIIIRAKPKRIISNINYIKAFLDENELSGSKGFLVTQIESAVSYIEKINHESLKMSEEEFNNKKNEWEKLNKKA